MPAESLVERYRDQIQKLYPPGAAMSRSLTSYLTEWAMALAVEFARVHERVDDLYAESWAGTASELLPDWEELVGLPNNCTYQLVSDAQRQAAVIARLNTPYGQSTADFLAIMYNASGGTYDELAIEPGWTFRTGITAIGGHAMHSDEWLFGVRMIFPNGATTTADEIIQCTLREHAHAHVHVDFTTWSTIDIDALSGLSHHYLPDQFVETTYITEWTNRITAASWAHNSGTPISVLDHGWTAFKPNVGSLGGLYHSASGSVGNDTLLIEKDFSLVMVLSCNRNPTAAEIPILTDSADITIEIETTDSSTAGIKFTYGTAFLKRTIPTDGSLFAVACDAGATQMGIQINNGTRYNTNHATVAVTGDQELILGDGWGVKVYEMIACDNDSVATVMSGLVTKYGIS